MVKIKEFSGRYEVFASLHEEIESGYVWIVSTNLPPRTVIHITNTDTNKSVWCTALTIDENFLSIYNKSPRITIDNTKSTLVMNNWYRSRLGVDLDSKREYFMRIKPENNLWGQLRASFVHPSNIIRIATWMAIISLILGVIGLILGLISLCH